MPDDRTEFVIEPSGRSDAYGWQVRRTSDDVIVGVYLTEDSAARGALNAGVKWLQGAAE